MLRVKATRTKMNKNWISDSIGRDKVTRDAVMKAQERYSIALENAYKSKLASSDNINKRYRWYEKNYKFHFKKKRMPSTKWGPTYVFWTTSNTARDYSYLMNLVAKRIGLTRKR